MTIHQFDTTTANIAEATNPKMGFTDGVQTADNDQQSSTPPYPGNRAIDSN